MRILQFSDIHLQMAVGWRHWRRLTNRRLAGLANLRVFGRHAAFRRAAERTERIVRYCLDERPDLVLFTGDATSMAFREEFDLAGELLAPLLSGPVAFGALPGNHDRYTVRAGRERRFETTFAAALASDIPAPSGATYPWCRLLGAGVAVIGLDSTRLTHVPMVAAGRLGRRQLRDLEALLTHPALAGRRAIVALHHGPLLASGRPDRPHHGLRDAGLFLDLCRQRQVDLVVHGHLHHPFALGPEVAGVRIVNCGSSTMEGHATAVEYELGPDGSIAVRTLAVDEVMR